MKLYLWQQWHVFLVMMEPWWQQIWLTSGRCSRTLLSLGNAPR